MTLETALLTRWLPWAALLYAIAFALLWRSLGRPRLRSAVPVLALTAAVALLTAGISSRQDATLRLSLAIAYVFAISLPATGLVWFLWAR